MNDENIGSLMGRTYWTTKKDIKYERFKGTTEPYRTTKGSHGSSVRNTSKSIAILAR
jgi:hypothetical protein